MPSVPSMKAEGYYDQHSSLQRATFEAVADWIRMSVERMELPEEPRTFMVADYGCSEGHNSILAVGCVVEAFRRRRPEQPVCGVHTDLPTNNFNQLFANLHDPAQSNYLQQGGKRRPHVYACAAGGSFYGPLLPPRSVHYVLSFLAVEWLDRLPDVPVPEFIGYMRGSPAAIEAFRCQAEVDLHVFYHRRAEELANGGKLLLVIPGRDALRSTADGLYDVLNDACEDEFRAGRVDRAHLDRTVMPVYFRSLEEMLAPVQRADSPLRGAFTVERAEVLDVPTPFVEQYKRTGDREAYAGAYTGSLRAFSEPIIAASLVDPGGDRSVVDSVYERVRARLLENPERYEFHNIEVAVLLKRAS